MDDHPGLISRRKVREIVTISGAGVRGYFPTYKGERLKFESLVEEDTLRIKECSTLVERLITQPCVLQLAAEGKQFRYTPDTLATISGKDYFVEVKADCFRKNAKTVRRLRNIVAHMRREGIPFILVTEGDVRANGLQEELKALLRVRPAPRRFDPDIDSCNWDPRNLSAADPDLMQRWRKAQQVCDDLIVRLIRRDPDTYLDVLSN